MYNNSASLRVIRVISGSSRHRLGWA